MNFMPFSFKTQFYLMEAKKGKFYYSIKAEKKEPFC